jgi:hypothetical protein
MSSPRELHMNQIIQTLKPQSRTSDIPSISSVAGRNEQSSNRKERREFVVCNDGRGRCSSLGDAGGELCPLPGT